MKKNTAFLLITLGIALGFSAAEARPGQGGIAALPSACSRPSPAGQNDGCPAAPLTGQFQNTSFFTGTGNGNARQSGQSVYAARPTWNVAGVDYPVGAYTADAGLIDASTNTPSGCSNVSGQYIRCNSTVTISGYYFNDIGFFQPSAGNPGLTFTNNHVTVGINTCRLFAGGGMIHQSSGVTDFTAISNTFDFTADCTFAANFYKKTLDPGLKTLVTGNLTIATNTLTINGTPTGIVSVGQYLDWSGISTDQVRITANVSPGGITQCSGAACIGTTWTVCKIDPASPTAVCNQSSPNVGPIAFTGGPIEATLSEAIQVGGGGTANVTSKYNAFLGYNTTMVTNAAGTTTNSYNYWSMIGCCGQHNNNAITQPNSGGVAAHVNVLQNFNTVVWNNTSQPTGTSEMTLFTTSQNANQAPTAGYQITNDLAQMNYNTLVANTTTFNGITNNALTPASLRYLSQGPFPSAPSNINFSLTGGVLTVTAFNSGIPLTVGVYIGCASCTTYTQITSFGTGSGGIGTYNVSNTLDTLSQNGAGTEFYPGIIGAFEGIGNYIDPTGNLLSGGIPTIFTLPNNSGPIGSKTVTGNINMLSGGACTPSSCP